MTANTRPPPVRSSAASTDAAATAAEASSSSAAARVVDVDVVDVDVTSVDVVEVEVKGSTGVVSVDSSPAGVVVVVTAVGTVVGEVGSAATSSSARSSPAGTLEEGGATLTIACSSATRSVASTTSCWASTSLVADRTWPAGWQPAGRGSWATQAGRATTWSRSLKSPPYACEKAE